MLAELNCSSARLNFCLFGERWRKATASVVAVAGLGSLAKECASSICRRAGLPRWMLEGKGPTGVFWTRRSEPYPPAPRSLLASTLASAK
eukprot:7601802-Pyramimonas_sp.AAC.1